MPVAFHQTFKPEKKHISQLLLCSDEAEGISLKDLSLLTGIPQGESSGKLVPHLFYAKYMNLLDYSVENKIYTLSLTDLGKLILEEDPYLEEDLTLLMLHCMLIRQKVGAELWNFTFNTFTKKYGYKVNVTTYKRELIETFGDNVTYTPLKTGYENLFESLEIIDINDDIIQIFSHKYNPDFVYLYAYVLFENWDLVYPDEDEITSIQLDNLYFRNAFGWDKEYELFVLENLAGIGLIRLNRQLMPYTILKTTTKDDLLENLYSELL